jgi:hypothetical protein
LAQEEWQAGSSRAWVYLLVKAVIGSAVLTLVIQWMGDQWLGQPDAFLLGHKGDSASVAKKANLIMKDLAVGFTFMMLIWMAWGGGRAARIIRHERYPAPGQYMLVKTRILRGSKAKRKGVILLAKSLIIGTLFIASAWEASHLIAHEMIVAGSRLNDHYADPPRMRPMNEAPPVD